MSDAAEQLAKALRDVVNEAVQAAVKRERPTPPPAPVVDRPELPEDDSELCPGCRRKNMRLLISVTEARQQLGGISRSTF
jgi:hypothetical protein